MSGIARAVEAHALDTIGWARGTLVSGPRQAGKTTLLRRLHARTGGTYRSLDDLIDLDRARADPVGFVSDGPRPLYIDEVQRGGERLVLALKAALDRDSSPGQVVLAGSSNFLSIPKLSESLAGRVDLVEVWPFTEGEIAGAPDGFIDRAFAGPESLLAAPAEPLRRGDYLERICRGGFPEAVTRPSVKARAAWLRSYATEIVLRDATEVSGRRVARDLGSVLRSFASITGQELNVSQLGRLAGVEQHIATKATDVLASVFAVHILPAFGAGTASTRRRPKVHLVDSGLAAALLDLSPTRLAKDADGRTGALAETFVHSALARQRAWAERKTTLHHVRDRNGTEVDIVIVASDGDVVGIEVKLADTVGPADARGLAWLRDKLDERFVAGVVLSSFPEPRSLGDRLVALPISALWTPAGTR